MEINWPQLFITLVVIGIFLASSIIKGLKILIKQGPKVFIKEFFNFLKTRFNFLKATKIKNPESCQNSKEKSIDEIFYERFPDIHPISFLKVHENDFRFNIILDSLQKNSYFGGVATSLILATLYSNKFDIPLRIITRFSDTNPKYYFSFLEMIRISRPRKIEFFSDFQTFYTRNGMQLEVSDKDIFLSTSWWSSQVVKSINFRDSFFYILQEVESFFYPNGDEQCLCNAILNDDKINFIINSKMLYNFYEKNNYVVVAKSSITFEPAFPEHMYYADAQAFQKKDKRKLFFYARPNNYRNLFYLGLKILDEALTKGLIGNEWDIYLAGSNEIPPFIFSNGRSPHIMGVLDWQNYLEFIKSVDVCLSLMHTPHPSYIPLDVASTGGVVLTNKYATKHSVPYSQNIICENLDNKSLLRGLEQALHLSLNSEKRYANYTNNRIEKNWGKSFESVLNYMHENK